MTAHSRQTSRLPARLLLGLLLAGAVIGGAVGALLGATRSPSYQATTVVSVLPDDAVTATQTGATPTAQDATDFIQSELVVINSRALRSTVERQLGLRSLPTVSASQQGTTYVVDITASASDTATAERIADATRTAYDTRRSAELTDDVKTAQTAVSQQISTVRAEIAATPGASANGNSALQQEYARLLAVSSSLQLAAGQVGSAVTTIQPATADGGGLSSTATWALGGVVLGLLAGGGLLLLLRRARPVIRTADDLDDVSATSISPMFDRSSPSGRTARLLASRLRNGDEAAGRGSVTVFIATTSAPGDDALVRALAAAYASSSRVLVVSPDLQAAAWAHHLDAARFGRSRITAAGLNAVAGRPASAWGTSALIASEEDLLRAIGNGLFDAARQAGWTVLADLPALGESDLGVRAAVRAGSAVLVATQGRTRRPELDEAIDLLEARGVPVVSVLLERPARRLLRAIGPSPVEARPFQQTPHAAPARDGEPERTSDADADEATDEVTAGQPT